MHGFLEQRERGRARRGGALGHKVPDLRLARRHVRHKVSERTREPRAALALRVRLHGVVDGEAYVLLAAARDALRHNARAHGHGTRRAVSPRGVDSGRRVRAGVVVHEAKARVDDVELRVLAEGREDLLAVGRLVLIEELGHGLGVREADRGRERHAEARSVVVAEVLVVRVLLPLVVREERAERQVVVGEIHLVHAQVHDGRGLARVEGELGPHGVEAVGHELRPVGGGRELGLGRRRQVGVVGARVDGRQRVAAELGVRVVDLDKVGGVVVGAEEALHPALRRQQHALLVVGPRSRLGLVQVGVLGAHGLAEVERLLQAARRDVLDHARRAGNEVRQVPRREERELVRHGLAAVRQHARHLLREGEHATVAARRRVSRAVAHEREDHVDRARVGQRRLGLRQVARG